jgi:hypothetical protein
MSSTTAQPTPAEVTAEAQRKAAEADASGKDGAKILLQNGMARIDYIRARWKDGVSRGQITKEVNQLRMGGTKEVQYQIIFSATKDVPGGPPKGSPEAAADQKAAEHASSHGATQTNANPESVVEEPAA